MATLLVGALTVAGCSPITAHVSPSGASGPVRLDMERPVVVHDSPDGEMTVELPILLDTEQGSWMGDCVIRVIYMDQPGLERASRAMPVSEGDMLGVDTLSLLGPQEVPVILMVGRNFANPDGVDLSWTGQASEFAVYESVSPESVVAPQNLLTTTGSCVTSESSASASSIVFYRVEPRVP